MLDHGATLFLAGDLSVQRSLISGCHRAALSGWCARCLINCSTAGLSLELIAGKLHLFSLGADAGPAILSSLVEGRPGLAESQTGPFPPPEQIKNKSHGSA